VRTFAIAFCILIIPVLVNAQPFCAQDGNLIIYSNYDGGLVTINVDANIPDLKIGICTYEPVQVTLTGPFVSNVTQVVYAGFASTQQNDNCGLGDFPTTITGVNPSIVSINVAPPAGLNNPNGYPLIIGVAGACSATTNAGGANTPDQVVYYFQQLTGGTFYAHWTQYQCWINQVYNVSAGGNCCVTSDVACVPPQVDAGGSISACTDQQITLGGNPTATGGNGSGYSYSWSPASGLDDPTIANPVLTAAASGTYSVTVSNGIANCSAQASVDVNVGSVQTLPVEVSGSLSLCAGESVELIAGAGFTDYLWSDGTTGAVLVVSSPGVYSVTGQGVSGCSAASAPLTVTENAPISVSVAPSGVLDVCDESATLTAQAGFGSYLWSDGNVGQSLLVTESGNYSVTATNLAGCSATSSEVQVNIGIQPDAIFTFQPGGILYQMQFSTNADPGATYLWDFGSGSSSNEPNPSFIFPYDGLWPVTLIVTNECGADTLFQLVEVLKLSLQETVFDQALQVTGSAGSGMFLSGESANNVRLSIRLLNMAGQLVAQNEINVLGKFSVPVPTDLPAGVYSFVISDGKRHEVVRFNGR